MLFSSSNKHLWGLALDHSKRLIYVKNKRSFEKKKMLMMSGITIQCSSSTTTLGTEVTLEAHVNFYPNQGCILQLFIRLRFQQIRAGKRYFFHLRFYDKNCELWPFRFFSPPFPSHFAMGETEFGACYRLESCSITELHAQVPVFLFCCYYNAVQGRANLG